MHSTDAVAAQVTQAETAQDVSLGATIGSVATSGPAGVNRSDTITYSPAGYDPVYGALTFNAAGNALDATINVGAGTVKKPLIILRGYTANAIRPPSNSAARTLTIDVDYFPSLRTDRTNSGSRSTATSPARTTTPDHA